MVVTLAIRSGVRGCVFEVLSCSHGGKIKDGGNGSGSVPHQLLSTSMTFWKVCHHLLTEVILCPSNLQAPAWHFASLERYVTIYGCPGTTQTARNPNISLYLHIYIFYIFYLLIYQHKYFFAEYDLGLHDIPVCFAVLLPSSIWVGKNPTGTISVNALIFVQSNRIEKRYIHNLTIILFALCRAVKFSRWLNRYSP